MKAYICVLLATIMMHFPFQAFATETQGMISTATVVDEMSRVESQLKITQILNNDEIKFRLAKLGISQDEISKRLATLSDSELRKLASQMDQARYGGDITGLLVVVVLVLLIVFLIKRI